jgi:hypothetical protein
MIGFKLGLLNGPYDLTITKINDLKATKALLKQLKLQYFKPEIENRTTWKIPKTFTSKMIDRRLNTLPCTFKNQGFAFNIEDFQEIIYPRAFDYQLVQVENPKPNEIGERME